MASRRKSTGLTNRDLGISGGSGKGSATRVTSSEKFAKNYDSINWGPKAGPAAFVVDLDRDCTCDSYFTDLLTGKTTKRGGGKVPKSVRDEAKRFIAKLNVETPAESCKATIKAWSKLLKGGMFPKDAGDTKRGVKTHKDAPLSVIHEDVQTIAKGINSGEYVDAPTKSLRFAVDTWDGPREKFLLPKKS